MPENIFLLLPLIGGFIFAKNWNKTKWYAARWEKERLLLNSALWGLLFFGVAYLIIVLQDVLPCAWTYPCLPRWPMDMGEFKYLGPSLLALIIGSFLWRPANLIWQKQEDAIIKNEGTLLDILANDSMKQRKTVLLTLKTGKVYTGFITSAASPGHSRPMLRILPTNSGYRHRDTQRVIFTAAYSEALDDLATDLDTLEEEIDGVLISLAELKHRAIMNPIDEETIIDLVGPLADHVRELASRKDRLASGVEDFGILIPVDEIASVTLYHAEIQTQYFTPLEQLDEE